MKKKNLILNILLIMLILSNVVIGGGEQTHFGIGLTVGLNRIDGDIAKPLFRPFTYGTIRYNLFEYLAVGAGSGYSAIGSSANQQQGNNEFSTIIIPYEGHIIFSFLPLGKINPYVVLGGGGFAWNYTENGRTQRYPDGKLTKGYDSFFKSGGGIEILLHKSHYLYFDLGFTYRYSLTDMLDNEYAGDLNDGMFDIYGGVTYYFRSIKRGDRDNDGVPDELDIKIDFKEDADGYMDHDGKPEGIPPSIDTGGSDSDSTKADTDPPVVIHNPIHRVEEKQDVTVKADIYEKKLKTASLLYRPIGFDGWKVCALRSNGGSSYKGIIPGRFVKRQGLEYCVIAVDEATSGVGYCGLPKLPVRVDVLGHPKTWRIASGIAALVGWGGSGYLMLKKQK